MKYRYLLPLLLLAVLFSNYRASAQLVGDNIFMQGQFLEVAIGPNGSWGNTITVPSGYHTHGSASLNPDPITGIYPTGNGLDFSYDVNHDGWTVGTEPFYGSYFLPGTPFDGWYMQVDGVMSSAFYTDIPPSYLGFNNSLGGGTLTGTNTSYTTVGTTQYGVWQGSAGTGGKLKIIKTNQLDYTASWLVVTIKFANTSAAVMKDVFYMVTADPDNDVPEGGSFATDNHITYQNDAKHRVEVNARPPLPTTRRDCFSGLCAKDARCRAMIYQSWPPAMSSDNKLDSVWSKTGGGSGCPGVPATDGSIPSGMSTITAKLNETTFSQDIAYGLLFHIGDIAPGDTAAISFAWIFSDTSAIDSAFPEPKLVLGGSGGGTRSIKDTSYSVMDTILGCDVIGGVAHMGLSNADEKNWTFTDWTWAPAMGLSATTGTSVDVTIAQIKGPTTYTVTGINTANCEQFAFQFYFTPCFTATSTNPCEGDSLLLAGHGDSTGATYLWYGPHGFTSTGQFAHVFPSTPLDTGMYFLVKTVGTKNDTVSTDGQIRFLPKVTATADTPCSQTDLHLKATYTTTVDSVLWTGPVSFLQTIQNPARLNAPTAFSGIYKVKTAWQGCFDSAYVTVVIDSTPRVPVGLSNSSGLPGEGSVCEGDTLKLYATDVTPGVTFLWSGPALFTATGANQLIAPVSTANSGVYTVTATFGKACVASSTNNVVINPTPPLAATSNSPVCSGGVHHLNLQATSAPGATFSWTGPHTFSSNDQNPVRLPVLMDYAGIYEVTAFLNGCYATRLDTVVVNETPLAPWTKWLTFCQYYKPDPLQAMGSNILWYTENVDTMIGSKVPPIPNTDVVGETFFYATQTVKNCISALDSMKITVYPKPVVTVTPDAVAVCPHDTAVLKAVDTDPLAYYHWYPSIYLNDTSSATVVIHPETNIHYTLVASNMFGCTDTGKVAVTVKSGATLEIGDTATIYPGEKFQLNPETNCSSFTWFPSTGLDNAYISNPVASPQVSTRYIVRGINNSGCKAVDSIDIHVSKGSLLAMPNAFAPGTGPNNKFKVIIRGIATIKSFTIFDRWGAKVFETADINEGWDGTYKGVPQPFGVYIYTIDAVTSAGEPFVKQGNVTLLR